MGAIADLEAEPRHLLDNEDGEAARPQLGERIEACVGSLGRGGELRNRASVRLPSVDLSQAIAPAREHILSCTWLHE